MKKSKEQVLKELGADQPGYWFSFEVDRYFRTYWSSKQNVKLLQEKMVDRNATIRSWRRSQTDWRTVNGLVLYDRFGSKITMNENPKEIEVKMTDVGEQHWHTFVHYELLDLYFYMPKIFEYWGGRAKMEELKEELTRLYRLFPANEEA